MARRPTTKDVAREAGVSLSTVDRALNGRARVRDETMRRIAQAAHRVGYHARGLFDRHLDAAVPEMTFGFLLIKQRQEFYQTLARELERAVAARTDIRGRAVVRFAASQSPDDFAAALRGLAGCDAIAATAVNHQALTQVVTELRQASVPVFSLLNDFAQGVRRNYLGLNNLKIGRIAASIITLSLPHPGKLAILVGGNRWHGHDLREVGFRSFVRENAPGFTVLETLVTLETRQLTFEATHDLLRRHPDLKGIYVAGGGMEGAIAALREAHPRPRAALVVHEVTRESRAALTDGYALMAITTPLPALCTELVAHMVRSVREGDDGISGQHFLDPHLVVPEML
ncbi:LacI family transcriptional regulator [Meridianimarinicoccus roseus]|uniref:LacI family transcriptional regulator n=1 Tax=Meridianimarinicoccus roseus TaxID=2072018 RepID=A0A2V2LLZ9_9RHOB|nr:LacI family DNA-binding transcriptional regulator [Meridianimarinicoccus roseus]PWR04634.1 LacI family transcriptional regulator [Meridianimarinicoccus roseus]